jgi:hypothetical protein
MVSLNLTPLAEEGTAFMSVWGVDGCFAVFIFNRKISKVWLCKDNGPTERESEGSFVVFVRVLVVKSLYMHIQDSQERSTGTNNKCNAVLPD